MPFPLPQDPKFRLEVVEAWLEDAEERLLLGRVTDGLESCNIAARLLLSLPPGEGSSFLEKSLLQLRVRLLQHSTNHNENTN